MLQPARWEPQALFSPLSLSSKFTAKNLSEFSRHGQQTDQFFTYFNTLQLNSQTPVFTLSQSLRVERQILGHANSLAFNWRLLSKPWEASTKDKIYFWILLKLLRVWSAQTQVLTYLTFWILMPLCHLTALSMTKHTLVCLLEFGEPLKQQREG